VDAIMKSAMAVMAAVTVLLLAAASAGATDIAGKWGIGASLFDSGFETSLIHGHSDRTAWVFDVSFAGTARDLAFESSLTPQRNGNTNNWVIAAGPALRRYTRPSSEFSPYGDVFASFEYQGAHRGGSTTLPRTDKRVGVATGFAFGLEYFTRRHFSIAADTNVLTLRWDRLTSHANVFGLIQDSTQDSWAAAAVLEPRLVVRAYF
jgi:hypothetical protein